MNIQWKKYQVCYHFRSCHVPRNLGVLLPDPVGIAQGP